MYVCMYLSIDTQTQCGKVSSYMLHLPVVRRAYVLARYVFPSALMWGPYKDIPRTDSLWFELRTLQHILLYCASETSYVLCSRVSETSITYSSTFSWTVRCRSTESVLMGGGEVLDRVALFVSAVACSREGNQ